MADTIIDAVGLNLTGLPDGRLDLLDTTLARFRGYGCDHVELTARRLDLVVGGRLHAARVDAVGAALDRAGLGATLHAHHGINLMDRDHAAMHRATAEASIEVCRRLGISAMVIHSGVAPRTLWERDRASLLAEERDALRSLGDLADRCGVRLAVENMIAKPTGSTFYA